MSSAAARSVAEFVLEYWKQPVSVLTAAYSSRASSARDIPAQGPDHFQHQLAAARTSPPRGRVCSAKWEFEGWWSRAKGHRRGRPLREQTLAGDIHRHDA